tara:strand:- start:450 stop:3002 length:2553 start_codon:yes stop_codon:yes gene_type:complete
MKILKYIGAGIFALALGGALSSCGTIDNIDDNSSLENLIREPLESGLILDLYGNNTYEIARRYFPEEFIAKNSLQLARIAEVSGDSILNIYENLSMDLLESQSEEIIKLINKYEDNASILFSKFGDKVVEYEKEYHELFERIIENSGRIISKNFDMLPVDLLENHSQLLLKIAETSGKRIGSAYKNIPRELLNDYSEELMKIAEAATLSTSRAFKHLTPEHMKYSDEIVRLSQITGLSAGGAIENLPLDLMEDNSEDLIKIAEATRHTIDSVFWYFPRNLMKSHPLELVELVQKYGEVTWGLFSSFEDEILEYEAEYADIFQRIIDATGYYGAGAFYLFPKELLKDYSEEIARIAETSGYDFPESILFLTEDGMRNYSDFLVKISEAALYNTSNTFHSIPMELLPDYSEELERIAIAAGTSADWAFKYLSIDMMEDMSEELVLLAEVSGEEVGLIYDKIENGSWTKEDTESVTTIYRTSGTESVNSFLSLPDSFKESHTEDLIKLAEKYEEDVWGLFMNFGKEVFDYEKLFREDFEKIAAAQENNAGFAFYQIPKDLLYNYSDFFVRLAETVDDVGFTYRYVEPQLKSLAGLTELIELTGIDPAFQTDYLDSMYELIEKNHAIFGITHFHRYKGSELLRENIRNLEKGYDPNKPVALIIHNKNDWNDAFSSSEYIKELGRLTKGYNRFIYETDKDEKGIEIIRYIGENFKDISLLTPGGHGDRISMNLGESDKKDFTLSRRAIEPYDSYHFDITDEEELRSVSQYLTEDASIILMSCSTGEGGESADNLANTFARAFEGRNVYSATEPIHLENFILGDGGYFQGIVFNNNYNDKNNLYIAKYESSSPETE